MAKNTTFENINGKEHQWQKRWGHAAKYKVSSSHIVHVIYGIYRLKFVYIYVPVVPHKAVAEVSKIGNL